MSYLDSSAAGRLLVADVGTAEMAALFRSRTELFSSSLLIAELLRVATRHRLAYDKAERIVRRVRRLATTDSVLREAGRLDVPGTWLRAADALHVVAATRLGQRTFITYDKQQAHGAEGLGFEVTSPGIADGWWR